MSEIREKGVKVNEAMRLIRKGVRKQSRLILLHFENTLPKKVLMDMFSYTVREYIPPSLRCFKCQRMGHVVGQCTEVCTMQK